MAAADVGALKVMSTWWDETDPSMKSSYKLPHHQAVLPNRLVWRGLTAAMGALLGARGGVKLPAADRRGVYEHLAKHYAEYDAQPPELRQYHAGELKQMFPDLYDVWPVVIRSAPVVKVTAAAPVVPVDPLCPPA